MKLLFRASLAEENELSIAKQYFTVVEQRAHVTRGDTILGRYSVLPYYRELEEDIRVLGGRMVNSFRNHRYVADLSHWYSDLQGITPETWWRLEDVPESAYPIVIKGETNSKKWNWNKMMFAHNRKQASAVCDLLYQDSMIGDQKLYFRKYVPLRTFMEAPQGLPITEEYRFFVYNKQVVTGAYYWANYEEEVSDVDVNRVPASFLEQIVQRVDDRCPFYVVDVARTAKDEWLVIELNDGQMSGLSSIEPKLLYENLKALVGKPYET
jgi:hypothetical protein